MVLDFLDGGPGTLEKNLSSPALLSSGEETSLSFGGV
jgi:hypothetical protein